MITLGVIPIALIVGVIVSGIGLMAYLVRRSGARAVEQANMRATQEKVQQANAVEREVAAESDAAVYDDLRRQRGG